MRTTGVATSHITDNRAQPHRIEPETAPGSNRNVARTWLQEGPRGWELARKWLWPSAWHHLAPQDGRV